MFKRFIRFVFPSMLAFVFSGLYTIIDGLFIGRNVGDAGLAAINIAYPLAALVQAVGTGLGMGGAVHLSLCRGKGDERGEKAVLGSTLSLLCLAGAVLTAVLLLVHRPLLRLFGAEGGVLEGACQYLHIILGGAVFQLFATGCTPLLRGYGASIAAMGTMVAGFLANIALDALLISGLSLGMAGAALATVLSQVVTAVASLLFLKKRIRGLCRDDYRLNKKIILPILKTGLSPFGLAMSPNVTIALMNKSAAAFGGSAAVAAFAVIAYVTAVIQLLLQGVGDGSQPLFGLYLGKGRPDKARQVRDLAYLTALLTACLNLLAMFFLSGGIPVLFGASASARSIILRVLPLFAAGGLFTAFTRVTTSYFYSLEENTAAYLLVYGEPVLTALFLTLLPRQLGLAGVWWSAPAAQAVLALGAVALLAVKRHRVPSKTS